MRVIFLVMILGCLVLIRRGTGSKWQWLARACLLLLLWLDIFTHAPDLSPTVERTVYEPDLVRQFFKWDNQLKLGEARAMPEWTTMGKVMHRAVNVPSTDAFGRRHGDVV